MTPGSPYHRAVQKERARLTNLLENRTKPDGSPKPGLQRNVMEIKRRLAKLPAEPSDDHAS